MPVLPMIPAPYLIAVGAVGDGSLAEVMTVNATRSFISR
jgi:hypothetical protein